MSEKLYALLLKLYPKHFRRAYGNEALRLVRDRARDEKGFLAGLRLWLDLLGDLATSLPHEYTIPPTRPLVAAHPASGHPSFQLMPERSLSPALLFLAGTLSAFSLWACVTSVAHSRTFPASFRDPHSLQWLVENDLDLARSRPDANAAAPADAYSFCMTALRDIPGNSAQPLFTFDFALPGASGAALLDGKPVKIFRNEQHLSIRTDVSAGDHQFVLLLDRRVENTSISINDDFEYCSPKEEGTS